LAVGSVLAFGLAVSDPAVTGVGAADEVADWEDS